MTAHDALCPVAGTAVPAAGCHPCSLIRAARADQDDRWHRLVTADKGGTVARGFALHRRLVTEADVEWVEAGAPPPATEAPIGPRPTAPLVDPDCRSGKHASCVGGVCACDCHGQGEAA